MMRTSCSTRSSAPRTRARSCCGSTRRMARAASRGCAWRRRSQRPGAQTRSRTTASRSRSRPARCSSLPPVRDHHDQARPGSGLTGTGRGRATAARDGRLPLPPMSFPRAGGLHAQADADREVEHEPARDRAARRVAESAHAPARAGEGADAHARRAQRRPPPPPHGADREGVRLRRAWWHGDAGRHLRGPPPALSPALHVRSVVERGLSGLQARRRTRSPRACSSISTSATRRTHRSRALRSHSWRSTRRARAGRSRGTRPTAAISTTTSTRRSTSPWRRS